MKRRQTGMAEAGLQGRIWGIDPSLPSMQRRRIDFFSRCTVPKPVFFALVLIFLIVAVSLLAPLVTPYGRDTIDLDHILTGPSPQHILGTDELGRDLLTRLIFGGRFTLLVAFVSVAIATVIGLTLGTLAGYIGGFADHLVSGAVDLFLSIPVFLVLLLAASFSGGRLWTIPLIIGATSWMETARLVRAEFLSLKGEEFVEAARSMGVNAVSLIFKHMLPHALSPVIVAATVGFAQAMLIESALSFLGYGVQPPLPTWGNMLQNAQIFLRKTPLAAFAPGFMICITCLCIHYVSEGLRYALGHRGHETV
ncbi:MAG: ABC transporter permease [bacterium]|nr:MAG: ABC transporter permease [bacterium]